MDLPHELREETERRLREAAPGDLSGAVAELSDQYRSSATSGAPVARSRSHALAYAAYRLPGTFAAARAAFLAICDQRPGWRPRTLLDLGAGVGAGVWAAADVWPSIERVTAVDAEPQMIALGRELGQAAPHQAIREASWRRGDLAATAPAVPHDLVLLSYVLGELPPAVVPEILNRAWSATAGAMVVVEPGTPPGYARVINARDQLLRGGGVTAAPCPHDAPCPLGGGDWCHFAVRLARSKTHRAVKQGSLGFEDEKFSYVCISREVSSPSAARVLRRPQVRPGRITLELCTPAGLKTLMVTRRDGDSFKRARKTVWGASWSE